MDCPRCGEKAPEGARFCSACGQALGETPAEATAADARAPAPVAGERRQATILFSDLSGFTALNERLDPEDVREVMAQVFGAAERIVSSYGGSVEKYIGDAIMAVFGLHQAHEDDALRAVRAAREIRQHVQGLDGRYRDRVGAPLAMHTGINTGMVVTGQVGQPPGTLGVVGDAVNTASRLSNLAQPGEILAGSDTHALVERFFHAEELPPTPVKGKADPVRVFRIGEPRERPAGTRRLAGVRAPLVGREVESALLKRAQDQLRNGKGSILALRGEAGTGKSRLVEEFRASLGKDHRWLAGIAHDHTRGIPYYPMADLLSRAWDIEDSDSPATVRDKLEAECRATLNGSAAEHLPFLGTLFALEYPEAATVSPEYRQRKLHEALLALFEAMAHQTPTVFFLEDLHWADPSTVALVRQVLTGFHVPTITLCAYRPPFHLFSTDDAVPGYREVELEVLSAAQVKDLTAALLQGGEVPAELLRFVRERAGGNPFFVEELLNALIENQTLQHSNGTWKLAQGLDTVNLPGTVQGVIAARLDRLEPNDKRLLQEAAVIGQRFFYEVLQRITSVPDDPRPRLEVLEGQDLIRAQTLEPELEYLFKHPLTQEVVYGSLLHADRQAIHERVGQAIETVLAERLPEYYERLAFHFLNGTSRLKAADYLTKAGVKATARFALDEADGYFRQGYELLIAESDRGAAEQRLLFDLLDHWGKVNYYRGTARELLERLDAHLADAEALDDPARQGMYWAWRGNALWFADRLRESEQALRRAIALGEAAGDDRVVAYACTWLAGTCTMLPRFDEGIALGERAHALAVRFPEDDYLQFRSLSLIANNYELKGDAARTLAIGERLVDYGQRNGNPPSLVLGYWTIAFGQTNAGDLPAALAAAKQAIHVSQVPYYALAARGAIGHANVLNRRFDADLEAVVTTFRSLGNEHAANIYGTLLGINRMLEGHMASGMRAIDEAARRSRANENGFTQLVTERVRGSVYLQLVIGDPPPAAVLLRNLGFLLRHRPFAARRAEALLTRVATRLGESGSYGYRAQLLLDLARLHKHKKRREQALACLTEAEGLFEQAGATVYLQQTRDLLSELGKPG